MSDLSVGMPVDLVQLRIDLLRLRWREAQNRAYAAEAELLDAIEHACPGDHYVTRHRRLRYCTACRRTEHGEPLTRPRKVRP